MVVPPPSAPAARCSPRSSASTARHRSGALLLLLLLLLDATITAALLLLLLPLVNLLRLRLVVFQLLLLDLLRDRCMSSSSTPACDQSRKLKPSSLKAVNGRLAEPHPQGSRPLARASTSLVRAPLPTLSLQPKLWLTGAIVSAPFVLAVDDVPHAESVGQVERSRRAATCGELPRRATTCRHQRCTAAAAAQARPIAPPRTSRPWPHYALCV